MDYAYTLQGWIKGVNGVSNDAAADIGRDNYPVLTEFNHSTVSKDVFSYELDYFNSDYRAIGTTDQQFKNPFYNYATETSTVSRQLFNGNIIGMSTSLSQFGLTHYRYRYDQLNRLKEKHSYKQEIYGLEQTFDFAEDFIYDANGNILNAERIAGQQSPLDVLTYQYENNSNKLNHVTDLIPSSSHDYDVDGQSAQNYTYDMIGNLVADAQEHITNINWSVYGKIRGIIKRNTTTGKETSTQYGYDPSGNRTYKEVIRRDIGNYSQDIIDRTYYVRDAQGNTMATYTRHEEPGNTSSLKWSEQHLYGSSRLGVINLNLDIPAQTTVPPVNQTLVDSLHTGEVVYELSNHLGNVMATISDKKLFSNIVIPETGAAAFYYPEVLSQTDYYAFGQEIKERAYRISGGYRYGFNGKEQDKETSSTSTYDYGFRIYNPALGRFLSVDPLTKSFPWYTPYQFAGNKPIAAIDLDGLEELWITNNCFAPFDLFGSDLFGSYSGDGEKRKFGDRGTYRTSGTAHINLTTAEKPTYVPGTSTSTYHRINSSGRDQYTTESKSRIQDEYYYSSPDNNYHHLQMHIAGSNKASLFGAFVDIDNHVNIYFERNPQDKSKVLVHGSVQGDRFPANETILNDKNGNQLILGVSSHNGPNKDLGPYLNLPGDFKRDMQKFSMMILFNEDETFKAVEFSGKEYSIEQWNKQFTKLDPKDTKVSTTTTSDGKIETKKPD